MKTIRRTTSCWTMLLRLFFCCLLILEHEVRAVPLRQTIVYPKVVQSRDDGTGHIVVITKDLSLSLEKSPSVFSEYFLTRNYGEGGKIFDKYVPAESIEKNLFHDDNAVASIFLTQEGGLRMEGVIGHRLRIKPIETAERSLDGDVAHILIENEPKKAVARRDDEKRMGELFSLENHPGVRVAARTNEAERRKTIARPEIHLLLDSHFTKAMSYDRERIHRYIAVFMNSVNIRYRTVQEFKIQLLIVGMTLVWSEQDEPWVVSGYTDSNLLFDLESLLAIDAQYLNQREYIQADIFFAITGRDLAFIVSDSFMSHLVMGYSFLGRACAPFKVGISEDEPETYEGIWVFTHEIAHLLGSTHDSEGPYPLIPGNNGAEHCPFEDGYIMSYHNKHDENRNRFSTCTVEQMHVFLSLNSSSCLYENNSHAWFPPTKTYAGEGNYSLDEFCYTIYGPVMPNVRYNKTVSYEPYYSCAVRCTAEGVEHDYVVDVPDGYPCVDAPHKICIGGRCVLDPRTRKRRV